MRVLLVVLSREADDSRGSLPFASFADAYYVFRDASVDLVLASRVGGYVFLDRSDADAPDVPASVLRFLADRSARDDVADTICCDDAHHEDFDGAMCIAASDGNAPTALPEHVRLLLSNLLSLGKPVVVIPEALAPRAGNGLLITGNTAAAPLLAANALVGALHAATPLDGS
jgi:hypothetical protein